MLHSFADTALIIFLRLPELGKVKTRIASTEGDSGALEIYLQLTAITLDLAAQSDQPVYLFYEGGLPQVHDQQPAYTYLPQSTGDLGKKMADAFSQVLKHHAKAVIIGSDCPSLTTTILHEAYARLELNDIVLGPSVDGGYYLIGCKKVHHMLFEGISWSTPSVMAFTIERIQNEGLTFCLLEELMDIDTASDWHQYQSK